MPRGRHRKPSAAPARIVPLLLVPGVLAVTPAPAAQAEGASQETAAAGPQDTRTWLGRSQSVAPGRAATLTAAVQTADGTPVAGKKVVVYQLTRSGWRGHKAGYTDRTGRAAIAVAPSRTARFGAAFAGGPGLDASASEQPVTVAVQESLRQRVVAEAARHEGKPYQWGAVGPHSFDCSGFVLYVMKKFGIELPHNSRAQYDVSRRIAKSEVRIGDLVFTRRGDGIGHVGIYAGDGTWWVARRSGTTVERQVIYTSDYVVGRVL